MKAARQAVVAAILIGVSVSLAHLHVVSQSYQPVVQLASPDGLVYTAVQDSKHERQECGAANDRFLAPVKQQCKQCRVVLARCERELGGGEALSLYETPQVAHVVRSGLRSAACVHPA